MQKNWILPWVKGRSSFKTGRNDGRFEVSRLKLGLKSDRFLSEKSALMHLCSDFDFGGGLNPLICHFENGQYFYREQFQSILYLVTVSISMHDVIV